MSITAPWIAGSGGSLLSNVDEVGLTIAANSFIQWKEAKVSTASTSATTIYTFVIDSSITTDVAVSVHYMLTTRGVGLATDNCRGQYNVATIRRTGGTWTVPVGFGGVLCNFAGAGSVTGNPTVTYVATATGFDVRVTAADTNAQEHWMFLKFVGVYE